MTIVLVIAIVATVACMVMLTYRIGIIEKKTDTAISMMDSCTGIVKDVNGYTTRSVKTANGNFTSIASALKNHGDDIAEITGRLDSIVADIERLDNDVAQVRRKEREIRSYYVNFREPKALPVYDTGVPWAKDQKCFDDMSNEEKIQELGKRADTYLDLMESGRIADIVKYTEEYNKCTAEIQRLLKGEKNE